MRTRILVAALAAAVFASTAANAGWREAASRFDVNRLAHLQEAKEKGLREASAGPDMAIIRAVEEPKSNPISAAEALGNWRCRTIKLGGMTPSVVYSWFRCRISRRAGGLYFQKLTGSQLMNGWLYPDKSGGLVLLAADTVRGEPIRHYSGDGASVGAEATPDDAVGVMTSIGPGHARIEFPYPVQESTFDVVELRR